MSSEIPEHLKSFGFKQMEASPGQVAMLMSEMPKVLALLESGKSIREVSHQYNARIKSLEEALKQAGKTMPSQKDNDRKDTQQKTAFSKNEPNAPAGANTASVTTYDDISPDHSLPGGRLPAPPETILTGAPLQAPRMASSLGPDGAVVEPKPSALSGAYETHDPIDNLFLIMLENGIKPDFARGYCRHFRHYNLGDYVTLERVLREGGVSPQARKNILATYKVEQEGAPGDTRTDVSRGSYEDRMNVMRKKLGLGAGDEGDTDMDRIERDYRKAETERMQLEVERMRRENEQMKSQFRGDGSRDDDMVDTVLEINGVPVSKRIKLSELNKYSMYMPQRAASQGVSPETRELKELLTKQEKEMAEMRQLMAKKEEDNFRNEIRSEIASLRDLFSAGPRTEDPAVKQMQQALENERREREKLRDEMQKRREEQLQESLASMRNDYRSLGDQLNKMSSWDYYISQQQVMADRAKSMGYIPRSDAARLEQEQLQLQAQREADLNKAHAQTEAISILAKKADNTGQIRSKISSSSAVDKALNVVADKLPDFLSTPEERSMGVSQPTPEELEMRARMMQEQMQKEMQRETRREANAGRVETPERSTGTSQSSE